MPALANFPSKMMGKSKVVLKKLFFNLTKQHMKLNIITYLCLIKDYDMV
jgi:hypothetical protein